MSEALMGLEAQEQTFVDRTLIDLAGTEAKSRLGANALLAASMAVARAAADDSGLSLYRSFGGSGPMQMPVPMMNVINGGVHANKIGRASWRARGCQYVTIAGATGTYKEKKHKTQYNTT